MKIGIVLGQVRLEQAAPGYESAAFCQVQVADEVLVAADPLHTRQGELVLLTQGKSARDYRMDLRCDALIVGKVENRNNG